MAKNTYIPDTGHIIELHFDMGPGNASAATKPALVLSPAAYNKRTGLMVVCAMTREIRGYPFEVVISSGDTAVLADQVKSLDWEHTKISHAGKVNPKELAEVRAKLDTLIFSL